MVQFAAEDTFGSTGTPVGSAGLKRFRRELTALLTGFPNAAVGCGQAQVPLHCNPFQRSATRRCPLTQASST